MQVAPEALCLGLEVRIDHRKPGRQVVRPGCEQGHVGQVGVRKPFEPLTPLEQQPEAREFQVRCPAVHDVARERNHCCPGRQRRPDGQQGGDRPRSLLQTAQTGSEGSHARSGTSQCHTQRDTLEPRGDATRPALPGADGPGGARKQGNDRTEPQHHRHGRRHRPRPGEHQAGHTGHEGDRRTGYRPEVLGSGRGPGDPDQSARKAEQDGKRGDFGHGTTGRHGQHEGSQNRTACCGQPLGPLPCHHPPLRLHPTQGTVGG